MDGSTGIPTPILSMSDVDWDKLLDKPIAFHRALVPITGSVNAALFLSQAIYWQRRMSGKNDGWWYKTRSEWTEETGLSYREQETAKKKLKKAGLIREEKRGMPPKMWYQVHPAILGGLLSDAKGNLETWKPVDKEAADSRPVIEDIDWAKVLSRPIAFHRRFVDVAGSINAALVLSQAFYWQHRISEDRGGWWYKTQGQWTEETGLGRYEQEGARKQLIEAGVLKTERLGMPAKMWYRLKPAVLRDLLIGVKEYRMPVDNQPQTDPPGLSEASKFTNGAHTSILVCTIPPTDMENAPEASKFTNGAHTSILGHSMLVCAPKECWYAQYPYKETEITTETTPPPQTPPPDETCCGRGGGGITGSAEREVIESKFETSESGESSDAPARETNAARAFRDLVFPAQLSGPERQGALTILSSYTCPDSCAQEILDVLAAIILAGEVRKSPLAVLRGLLERWKGGTFDATTGLHLAVARRRKAEIEARMNAPPAENPARPPKARRIPPETIEVFRRLRGAAGRT